MTNKKPPKFSEMISSNTYLALPIDLCSANHYWRGFLWLLPRVDVEAHGQRLGKAQGTPWKRGRKNCRRIWAKDNITHRIN